jgi:hypoxanthine-DNA glycosylase
MAESRSDPAARRAAARRKAAVARAAADRLAGFAPVVDARAEILILGSFPGRASLAHGQYYAHPRNQFWPILGAVLGEPLADLPYRGRLARLRVHGIGLWDVLAACSREGSLDADIRSAQANDFDALLAVLPRLRRVLFNGQAAGRFAPLFARAGLAVAILPSTSPAYAALPLEDKLLQWRQAVRRGAGRTG